MRATANLFCEAGWDVTAITIDDEGWEREFGVDPSLSEGVDPHVRVVRLPLSREDLDPDIRRYSEFRVRQPRQWLAELRARELESFPEPVFGLWRAPLEDAAVRVHQEKPADLVLVSPAPNTGMAAAWRLWSDYRVPYAIDYRDAWSLRTYEGVESFPKSSPAGEWEEKVVSDAVSVWCVNNAIAEFYRARYPSIAGRIRTVPNGFDPFLTPVENRVPVPEQGLTFGFLGTANFPADMLRPLIEAWRQARTLDPVVGRSRLVFRGHFGAGMARGATRHVATIESGSADAVSYGGPVAKRELGAVYSEWDALVLLIPGGRYVTAGKTYEYLGTGLPIMSVHAQDHGAVEVLDGYPLWVAPPVELTPEALARSFVEAADVVLKADEARRMRAREFASQFERRVILAPAVHELIETVVVPQIAEGGSG
jgi:glycosyltransferase involved in cell wall biosynthesis